MSSETIARLERENKRLRCQVFNLRQKIREILTQEHIFLGEREKLKEEETEEI